MSAVNSLWLDDQFTPFAPFTGHASDVFTSAENTADLQSQDAAEQMGRWVARHTENMLNPAFEPRDHDGRLSVINTVFAYCRWKQVFERDDTKPAAFRGLNSERMVPFMHQQASEATGYVNGNGYERADIAFDNGGIVKVVLPEEGRIDQFASDASLLRTAFGSKAHATSLNLALPRFTVGSTFSDDRLTPLLTSIMMLRSFAGIEAIFDG